MNESLRNFQFDQNLSKKKEKEKTHKKSRFVKKRSLL